MAALQELNGLPVVKHDVPLLDGEHFRAPVTYCKEAPAPHHDLIAGLAHQGLPAGRLGLPVPGHQGSALAFCRGHLAQLIQLADDAGHMALGPGNGSG